MEAGRDVIFISVPRVGEDESDDDELVMQISPIITSKESPSVSQPLETQVHQLCHVVKFLHFVLSLRFTHATIGLIRIKIQIICIGCHCFNWCQKDYSA